jgi:hypothetical protein
VTGVPQPTPDYRWAINAEPDFLVLRLPPVPVSADGGSHDAMKALFARRGFQQISEADELDLGPANGCSLTRVDPTSAELLVRIGDSVGASRIPLPDIDSAWLARVIDNGHAAVLVVDTAVRADGTTTKEDLRRDIDAGGVLAALVPSADRE